ncbi:MAG: helix-turn-helix transcriptional regulator [bacterium]|nr:helix-turn-helix transcriptional regulator [bacterium]
MNLGSRLKTTLRQKSMTVIQLSKASGVPAQTIYALINRDSNKADLTILGKLLSALDMDFFTFMDGKEPAESEAAACHTIAVSADSCEKLLALAREAGIEDQTVIQSIFEEYIKAGFGCHPTSFASLISSYVS